MSLRGGLRRHHAEADEGVGRGPGGPPHPGNDSLDTFSAHSGLAAARM